MTEEEIEIFTEKICENKKDKIVWNKDFILDVYQKENEKIIKNKNNEKYQSLKENLNNYKLAEYFKNVSNSPIVEITLKEKEIIPNKKNIKPITKINMGNSRINKKYNLRKTIKINKSDKLEYIKTELDKLDKSIETNLTLKYIITKGENYLLINCQIIQTFIDFSYSYVTNFEMNIVKIKKKNNSEIILSKMVFENNNEFSQYLLGIGWKVDDIKDTIVGHFIDFLKFINFKINFFINKMDDYFNSFNIYEIDDDDNLNIIDDDDSEDLNDINSDNEQNDIIDDDDDDDFIIENDENDDESDNKNENDEDKNDENDENEKK
jgi:hypothetical protein